MPKRRWLLRVDELTMEWVIRNQVHALRLVRLHREHEFVNDYRYGSRVARSYVPAVYLFEETKDIEAAK